MSRTSEWSCPACGYDLRASVRAGSCPECGRPFTVEELEAIADGSLRLTSKATTAAQASAMIVLAIAAGIIGVLVIFGIVLVLMLVWM